jgi:hypothetical protein
VGWGGKLGVLLEPSSGPDQSFRKVHAARDAGELDEFPGTPDTKGEIFTVNCPVPVLAPNTFVG